MNCIGKVFFNFLIMLLDRICDFFNYSSRHLLRLWLRNEDFAWKLPKSLQTLLETIYDVKSEDQTFALEPEVREQSKGKT